MHHFRHHIPDTLRRLASCGSLALALGLCPAAAKQGAAVDEYAVKAAVLCNLPKFVEWPPRPGEPPLGPWVIGVVEPDPFGAALDAIAAASPRGSRGVVVRRIRTPEQALGVHVLFVAADALDADAIRAQAGPNVLTVGESDRFLAGGGVVRLLVLDGKIRFEINRSAAAQAGLKLSSQLLQLASRPIASPGSPP